MTRVREDSIQAGRPCLGERFARLEGLSSGAHGGDGILELVGQVRREHLVGLVAALDGGQQRVECVGHLA